MTKYLPKEAQKFKALLKPPLFTRCNNETYNAEAGLAPPDSLLA